jgi:hypothetical protein
MFKLRFSQFKTGVAIAVVASSAIMLSSAAPASAVTLTGTGGTGVTDFKAGEWVHLIYPTPATPPTNSNPAVTNPIAGVMILQALTNTAATFRIRIDNNLTGARVIDRFRFDLLNTDNVATVLDTTLAPVTQYFDQAGDANASGDRRITVDTGAAGGSNLPINTFDEFILTITRSAGTFNTTTGIGLDTAQLRYVLGSADENLSLRFSTIPTPALLPGLVGLGLGMVRRKRKQAAALATTES